MKENFLSAVAEKLTPPEFNYTKCEQLAKQYGELVIDKDLLEQVNTLTALIQSKTDYNLSVQSMYANIECIDKNHINNYIIGKAGYTPTKQILVATVPFYTRDIEKKLRIYSTITMYNVDKLLDSELKTFLIDYFAKCKELLDALQAMRTTVMSCSTDNMLKNMYPDLAYLFPYAGIDVKSRNLPAVAGLPDRLYKFGLEKPNITETLAEEIKENLVEV